MSSKSAPTNPPQYSIEDFCSKYGLKALKPELNQLIYTQVLELIDTGAFIDPYKTRQELIDDFRQQLRNKAKAKYIGGSDE